MKRVKSAPKTIVFKNSRENITFAFGIGKHWGLNAGIEYWEVWDWHHFVTGFTIIKFFVTFKINWRIFGQGYDRNETYYSMYDN